MPYLQKLTTIQMSSLQNQNWIALHSESATSRQDSLAAAAAFLLPFFFFFKHYAGLLESEYTNWIIYAAFDQVIEINWRASDDSLFWWTPME